MPIPLLLVGLGTAAVGISKTVKAGEDQSKAKSYSQSAQDVVEEATRFIKKKKKETNDALTNLGKKKVEVMGGSMKAFFNNFKKVKNVNFSKINMLAETYRLDPDFFRELENMENMASSLLLEGVASGAAAGAITAFGAYGVVSAFGTASTGVAISALSGQAAANATLAFLGGGSLAAGGLGMAGGSMVLGGLMAGPALAIMGVVVGSKANANREKAYSNLQEAKAYKEKIIVAGVYCEGIRKRSNMFYKLLIRLDELLDSLVYSMEQIIDKNGSDYENFSIDQREVFAKAIVLANTITTVLNTCIITEEGILTEESEQIAMNVKNSFEDK